MYNVYICIRNFSATTKITLMKKRFTCLLSGIIFTIGVYGQVHNTHNVTATPTAAFSGAPLTVCACQTVTFTDASTNGPNGHWTRFH